MTELGKLGKQFETGQAAPPASKFKTKELVAISLGTLATGLALIATVKVGSRRL